MSQYNMWFVIQSNNHETYAIQTYTEKGDKKPASKKVAKLELFKNFAAPPKIFSVLQQMYTQSSTCQIKTYKTYHNVQNKWSSLLLTPDESTHLTAVLYWPDKAWLS